MDLFNLLYKDLVAAYWWDKHTFGGKQLYGVESIGTICLIWKEYTFLILLIEDLISFQILEWYSKYYRISDGVCCCVRDDRPHLDGVIPGVLLELKEKDLMIERLIQRRYCPPSVTFILDLSKEDYEKAKKEKALS